MADLGTCERCTRPATVYIGGFADLYVCRGHQIWVETHAAMGGKNGLSDTEYDTQIQRAISWFRENPEPDDQA